MQIIGMNLEISGGAGIKGVSVDGRVVIRKIPGRDKIANVGSNGVLRLNPVGLKSSLVAVFVAVLAAVLAYFGSEVSH